MREDWNGIERVVGWGGEAMTSYTRLRTGEGYTYVPAVASQDWEGHK